MSTEENKAIVRRAYDALNQKNWEVTYEAFSPDIVLHNASTTMQGLEAFKQFVSAFLTAFPDARFSLEDMIAEGDTVVTRQTFRGTHTGNFMGIPPTGKQVSTTGILITRLRNGKVVEQWSNYDDLGLLQQLGVVPLPGQ
jgi:steroid delta-isomerase-like uncharacterized protein